MGKFDSLDQDEPKKASRGQQHPMHGNCRVSDCGAMIDGDDHVCGYHRALSGNDIAAWRESQRDRCYGLFADFRSRHKGDMWGTLIDASYSVRSVDDKRELLATLKRQMPKFTDLPYDPQQREVA